MKGEDGRCVSEEERDKQQQTKKPKKKKKKKKKGNEEEEEGRRPVYLWYCTIAPLSIAYLVYKYWKPNIVTSVGMLLFFTVSATLHE